MTRVGLRASETAVGRQWFEYTNILGVEAVTWEQILAGPPDAEAAQHQ